ncbi:nodulin-related protein 1 [Solanum pennellii]|uniref:Nodulin-related protein 1 n=1 Tax=Solanum pennellii TaxID=28526 RepID=A0ABM1GWH6_SOLPN|nr:nodulin-related protein 1 [Solanum pennellii]
MNFLSSLAKSAGAGDDSKKAGEESGSTTELFASAKVLADAAQSQFNKDSEKIDNKKVAEAAADVLDAAQKYGKLDETQGIGQYVEKAQTYLHQYGGDKAPAAAPVAEEAKAPAPAPESNPAPAPVVEGDKEEEKKSEGADYLKMAGDFLSKK